MLRVLSGSASGLNSQQIKVDTIAHNLANLNTTGFKKSRVEFSEQVRQEISHYGIPVAQAAEGQKEYETGSGVKVAGINVNFQPGNVIETGRPLDLAVLGEGFFKVILPDGEERYTRDGCFSVDLNGRLVTSSGYVLDDIEVAPGSGGITVAPNGTILSGEGDNSVEARQIMLYKVTNKAGLKAEGGNLFSLTAGEALPGSPGSEGLGLLGQGCLEAANVDLTEEMADLIVAQRAYAFNSRTMRTADEMWSLANNLRK